MTSEAPPVAEYAELFPDAVNDEGHLVISWGAKRFGFGLLTFQTRDGVLVCDNECMSRRFCRTVLEKLCDGFEHTEQLPALLLRFPSVDALLDAAVPLHPMLDWQPEAIAAPLFGMMDVVRLRQAREGLPAGTAGTIVEVHDDGEAFEVEFCNDEGQTLGVVTLPASALEPTGKADP